MDHIVLIAPRKIAGFHSVSKTGLACVSSLDAALSGDLSSVLF